MGGRRCIFRSHSVHYQGQGVRIAKEGRKDAVVVPLFVRVPLSLSPTWKLTRGVVEARARWRGSSSEWAREGPRGATTGLS